MEDVERNALVLEAALGYVKQGYRVHPLHPGTKIPVLRDWPEKASADAKDAYAWFGPWGEYEGYNLGIATGRASDLWVLDVDTGHGPQAADSLGRLLEQYGPFLDTCIARTPSSSMHLWFHWPAEVRDEDGSVPTWRNIAGTVLGPGIDVRGEGGQVAVWPSVLADGSTYGRAEGARAEVPDWLAERTRFRERRSAGTVVSLADLSAAAQDQAARYGIGALRGVLADLDALGAARTDRVEDYVGRPWDTTCFSCACSLVELANADWSGVDLGSAETLFAEHAPSDRGFTDVDHDRIWKSATRSVGDRQRPLPVLYQQARGSLFGPDPASDTSPVDPTTGEVLDDPDAALRANLFNARGRPNLDVLARVVASDDVAWGDDRQPWVYSGGAWRPSPDEVVRRCVREVGGAWRHGDLATVMDHLADLDLPRVGNATHQALLNTRSGMVDWATGDLLPHDPGLRSTIQLPVDYDPAAACPRFDAWMGQVFSPSVLPRAWELVGYMLLSGNPRQAAILLYGPGGNGKSTLIRVLQALIGRENCSAVDLRAMATDAYNLADLYGKQANLAGDVEPRYLANTGVFKALTGGDAVTVRQIYSKPFTFTCHATPLFSTNELWRSSDNTAGYLRRWVHVPMTVKVADLGEAGAFDERDLLKELPGILNGALVGLRRVMSQAGFTESVETRIVKDEFEERSDMVRIWLAEDEAVVSSEPESADQESWRSRQALYSRFARWCGTNGHDRPMTSTKFYGRLRTLGYVGAQRAGGKRGFLGIMVDSNEDGYVNRVFT